MTPNKTQLLVVDDDPTIREAIRWSLSDEDYAISECADLDAAYHRLVHETPDLLVLDVHFGGGHTSLELLGRMARHGIEVPTIVISGAATASEAAQAIKYGAYDFLDKPLSGERLRLTLRRCLEHARLKERFEGFVARPTGARELVGRSAAITGVQRQIEQFGPKDVKVLLLGETGTGKEVVAHALWERSARSEMPFIIVNSAAVPETLLESELFGHKKGAFTGAVSDHMGKIEMADGGTLFLDEIGDLPPGAQTKLLRFLESGEIQKVGSTQIRRVDVRLIAATSRNLEQEIRNNRFRSDLYYRLNVATINLLPLRDRRDDIAPLFTHFVASFCKKFGETPKIISPEAIALLEAYAWPGNARELRNVAEKAVIIASDRILPEHVEESLGVRTGASAPSAASDGDILPLREYKARMERAYIESVLARTKGSVPEAARLLGIDRTYLYQKMTQHKLGK